MARVFRSLAVGPYRRDLPGDGATLMSDDSYQADGTRPGVLVCHSAGQRHYEQVLAEWWPVPRALAESGEFVCLACDLGDPAVEDGPTSARYSWGNEHSLKCLSDAHLFLTGPEVGARPGRVLLVGTSMGALIALNWALTNRDLVAGVMLGCPVLDLEQLCRSSPLATSVAAAYQMQTADLPGLASYSPIAYAPRLGGLPIRIYASRNDPSASDIEACRAFAERVGSETIQVVDLGMAGHWPVDTPVGDALSFARSLNWAS